MTARPGWSRARALELAHGSGFEPLDLSLGVPAEPPPALPHGPEPAVAGYPLSAGSAPLRRAAAGYLARRFGVTVPESAVAACAGAKEFIATLPVLVRAAGVPQARHRDVALIPALGYPPYEFGARLAGLEVHRVPTGRAGGPDLGRIPDHLAARALYLWANSPANPTGAVAEDPSAAVRWGRERGVLVLSDEAYAEMTWTGAPRTALAAGLDGVLAVHSLAKRSNAPGLRVGFYAGDPALVDRIAAQRRSAGLIAAGDSQAAAAVLLQEDAHVTALQARTAARLAGLVASLDAHGLPCSHPAGGPFVWLPAPGGDGVRFAETAAAVAGLVVAPGVTYGPTGVGHVRLAAVVGPGPVEPRLAVLAAAVRHAGRHTTDGEECADAEPVAARDRHVV